MKVNREDLLKALIAVQPGLSPKELLQQSNCYVLKGQEVYTYNSEVYCAHPTPLVGITGALTKTGGDKLVEILTDWKDAEEVTVSQTPGKLILERPRKRSTFHLEQEILLEPLKEKPATWKPLPKDFADAVRTISQCTQALSKSYTLFLGSCLHIHPEWIEACDGSQFARWKMKTGLAKSVLVRSLGIRPVSERGVTQMSASDNWLHFENAEGFRYSCRRYLDSYEDFSALLETAGKRAVFPRNLGEEVKLCSKFSEESEKNLVRVDLKPGAVRVQGKGISGDYEARPSCAYEGPRLSFLIAPDLLTRLVKDHTEILVGDRRLKVEAGQYVYIASTFLTERNGEVG